MYATYERHQQQNGGVVVVADEENGRGHFQAYPADSEEKGKKSGASGLPLGTTQRVFIITLVLCDIMLVGLQPILVQFSKTGNKFNFNPICVNLLIEASKATFMLCMIFAKGLSKPRYGSFSARAIFKIHRQNYLLVIPAVLYAINNYLKFVMQLYFEPTTVKMIHNLKVFFIALLSRFLLKRYYSVFQWEALMLLVLGVTVNQMAKGSVMRMDIQLSGWIYTSVSIGLASLASVFNEKLFKGTKGSRAYSEHVVIQCFALYFFGTCLNLCGFLGYSVLQPGESSTPHSLRKPHGYDLKY